MYLFLHFSAQSPGSGSFKILFFFSQTLTMIIPLSFSSEWVSWISLMNFDITGFRNFNGESIFGCPFEVRGYNAFLVTFIRPVVLVVTLVSTFAIAMIIRLVCTVPCWKASSRESQNERELNLLSTSSNQKESLQQMISRKSKWASKTTVTCEHLFLKPNCYSLSGVSVLITTYQALTEVPFKFIACITIGDERRVLSSTDMICGSSTWLGW